MAWLWVPAVYWGFWLWIPQLLSPWLRLLGQKGSTKEPSSPEARQAPLCLLGKELDHQLTSVKSLIDENQWVCSTLISHMNVLPRRFCGGISVSPCWWCGLTYVGEASFPVKSWHRNKTQNRNQNQLRIGGRHFDCSYGFDRGLFPLLLLDAPTVNRVLSPLKKQQTSLSGDFTLKALEKLTLVPHFWRKICFDPTFYRWNIQIYKCSPSPHIHVCPLQYPL